MRKTLAILFAAVMIASLSGCGEAPGSTVPEPVSSQISEPPAESSSAAPDRSEEPSATPFEPVVAALPDLFVEEFGSLRIILLENELIQNVDPASVKELTLKDGETTTVAEAGVYRLSGSYTGAQLCVEAPQEAEIRFLLDGLSMKNAEKPCMEFRTASEVYLMTAQDSRNALEYSGENEAAAIRSEINLCLCGLGSISIDASYDGIVSAKGASITGGTIEVRAGRDGVCAYDFIEVADGVITVDAGKNALRSDSTEERKGFMDLCGGSLDLSARDTAIFTDKSFRIYGGTAVLSAPCGVECGSIVNFAGSLTVYASEIGIHAVKRTDSGSGDINMFGQELTVVMDPPNGPCIDGGQIFLVKGLVQFTSENPIKFFMNLNPGLGPENKGITLYVNGKKYVDNFKLFRDFDLI